MGSFNASLKTIGDTRGIPASVELQEGRLSIRAGDAEIGDWPLDEVTLNPTPTGYRLAAEGDQVLLEMTERDQFGEELERFSESGRKKKRSLFSRKEKKREPEVETPPAPPVVATPPKPEGTVSRIPASVMGAASSSRSANRAEPKPAPVRETGTTAKEKGDGTSLSGRLVDMLDRTIDATEKRWGPLLPNWVFNRIVFVAGFVLMVLAFVFRGTTSLVLLVTGVLALMVGGVAYTDDVMASKLLPGRATPTHLMLVGIGLLGVGIAFGFIS
jgi:hypothetical protein